MRLRSRLTILVAVTATFLTVVAGARAASAPTVKIAAATSVTTSSAHINATLNPNGSLTSYHFDYGPTSALGIATATKSAGSGTRTVSVSAALTGLQSGTTYSYDVVAQNAGGTVTSRTITFKTAGAPPAQAQTGGAQVLGATSATLTGVVNPEGADTAYYFEYGTTAGSYTVQTVPRTIPRGTAPVPVSVTLTGLAPGVVFHYALVATHGGINTGAGADAAFETFPDPVPAPRVTQRTTPRAERGGPYVFTTTGQVINTTATPAAYACTGVATIAFYYGKHRVSRQLAPLSPTCAFAATTTFRRLPVRHHRSEKLLVYVRFDGNGYLRPVSLRPETVSLG